MDPCTANRLFPSSPFLCLHVAVDSRSTEMNGGVKQRRDAQVRFNMSTTAFLPIDYFTARPKFLQES